MFQQWYCGAGIFLQAQGAETLVVWEGFFCSRCEAGHHVAPALRADRVCFLRRSVGYRNKTGPCKIVLHTACRLRAVMNHRPNGDRRYTAHDKTIMPPCSARRSA